MATTVPARFAELMGVLSAVMHERELDGGLADTLTETFPPDGPALAEVEQLCRQGIQEGWLCARESGGIKYGRVIKTGPQTHGYSIDVVEMRDVVGPHHRHPNGEVDLVLPIDASAQFDDTGRGWKVYGAGSAHHPTVSGGAAIVIYFLPDGAIEFTGA